MLILYGILDIVKWRGVGAAGKGETISRETISLLMPAHITNISSQ